MSVCRTTRHGWTQMEFIVVCKWQPWPGAQAIREDKNVPDRGSLSSVAVCTYEGRFHARGTLRCFVIIKMRRRVLFPLNQLSRYPSPRRSRHELEPLERSNEAKKRRTTSAVLLYSFGLLWLALVSADYSFYDREDSYERNFGLTLGYLQSETKRKTGTFLSKK